jgi:hypothetical protein
VKITLREIVIIAAGLFAITSAGLALWKSMNQPAETMAGTTLPQKLGRQNSPVPTEQKTTTPAKPKSVMEGVDGPLILSAQETLLISDEAQRMTRWQSLLDQAGFYELIRMTEIPAVPKLDEGRKALRLAAVRQLAKTGMLQDLITLRRKFDGENFSGVLMMAYQEWTRKEPKAALANWMQEGAPLKNASWSDSLARGLAQASTNDAVQAIASLPSESQIRLSKTLIKELKTTLGVAGLRDFYTALQSLLQNASESSSLAAYHKLITTEFCNEAPAAAADWAWINLVNSPETLYLLALRQAIQTWYLKNPGAVIQWAENKVPSPAQEELFLYLVEVCAPADPVKAKEWAMKINRAELKEKAAQVLAGKSLNP